jgi:uncharacterized protein YdiU (UPF0061 family)
MQPLDQLWFDNSFARLPADLYSRILPTPLAGPTRLAAVSPAACALIDLDLCLVHGDEEVYRERIETGAILTRLAPSHVRFGIFEALFPRGRFDLSQRLGHDLIECHYPELVDSPTPWLDLLHAVLRRTACLIAQWQLVGFAHAVMSSDNMSMLGLTIDYGPFGYLDACDPKLGGNHSNHWGRYAFERQPAIAKWNLICLAQAMLPLLDPEDGEHAAGAQDYGELNRLLAALSRPYDEQPEHAAYAAEPPDWGRRLAVSCAS